jgi:hypothetical protein
MTTITYPRASSPSNIARNASPAIPSAISTPSSSVRHSLDLPNRDNTAVTPANAATSQRRNRAALRDYYNLKAKNGGTSPIRPHDLSRTASITSTTSDSTVTSTAGLTNNNSSAASTLPAHLDDPSFDAEKYIADLLKTCTLRDILRIESTLVSEVRNLDGERKALVYDNYSKLIKAVGTIADMQKGMRDQGDGNEGLNGVKGLEGKLEALVDLVKDMNGQKKQDESLKNQDEARMLRGQRRKKDLVRWVLDAPKRLEALIGEDKREEAERDWQKVEELLGKWHGVKGVEDVKHACEVVMNDEPHDEGHAKEINS